MTVAQLAADRGLHRVGARPPLASYLKQTWARRQFIVKMAQFRLRADLDDNRLGVVWLLLQPVLNAIVYGTIFYFLQSDRRPTDYVAHVVIGVFLFEFFQGFVNHALVTLHIDNLRGHNTHHQIETVFKAFGRALRMAVTPDPRQAGVVPSTKGAL